MELFLGRIKREQDLARVAIDQPGKECSSREVKWLEVLTISRNAVLEFEKGDWRRALQILYRKDEGLKRPQDLVNALKKMASLRKEL